MDAESFSELITQRDNRLEGLEFFLLGRHTSKAESTSDAQTPITYRPYAVRFSKRSSRAPNLVARLVKE